MLKNVLFVIMMSPLLLSFYNRATGIENTITDIHIYKPMKPWIIWEEHEYIWEKQERFGTAFRLARTLLGTDDVFTWNGKQYTTLYKEEL